MQSSFDSLLIALLVVLAPEQDSRTGERLADSFQFAAPPLRRSIDPSDGAPACRQFADAEARRKCMIRTGRSASGSAEVTANYPETLFWVTPADPEMPFKFGTNPQR